MIHQNGRHLEFGKGDIGIHMGTTAEGGLLLFRNLEKPAPIGTVQNRKRRKEIELLDTDVLVSFSNTESIDALMKCLMVIRKKMCTSKPANKPKDTP